MRTLLILACTAALAACGPSGNGNGAPRAGMPPAEVRTVTVQPQAVPAPFEYTGQTAGSREVEVRARVTGILLKRSFTEGGAVRQGQSLYTIDPAPFQAALARAEADVGVASARLDQAKRESARLRTLVADKFVSQKLADDAASAEAIGDAELKAARARLTEARLNLEYTRVESPVNGIASRSLRSEGTLVSGSDVLLTTVTQVDPIWVNFGIPDDERLRLQRETDAGRLVLPKDGRFEVTVRLADGSVYGRTGRLAFADIRISGQTGTSDARAELPNPEGRLRPGQFVRVTLSGATRPNAVLVPQRAVLEGPQGKFVYVVDEKSAAQARPVEVGEWVGSDWIVTGGLKPGERVIIDGVMRIGPGAPVKIADAAAQKPAADAKAAKP
ncbi:MAG TPA: efflux RND transporter periplasmic adaptor subunit [Burkholderiales bacterium]|nr:efflux RND transporter periplasmic adaptor subunit [Burkholderiales bacterium]